MAVRKSEKAEEKLRKKIMNIGVTNNLPPPEDYRGKFSIDDKTGAVYKSSGDDWLPSSVQEYEESKKLRGPQGMQIPGGL